MRWWCVLSAILFASYVKPDAVSSTNVPVTAVVSVSVLGAEDAALALQKLTIGVLRDAGIEAAPVKAPPSCLQADDHACLTDTLRALTSGNATVALVTVPPGIELRTWELRENGIEELGELSAPSRRSCLATQPPARSLLDLADDTVAAYYHVPKELIINLTDSYPPAAKTLTPEWCENKKCATILTSDKNEAEILWREIRAYRLYASIQSLGQGLPRVASLLAPKAIIACDWAPELSSLAYLNANVLGPPPCLPSKPCPFETRRTVKFVNLRELARAPSGVQALVHLRLSEDQIRKLNQDAINRGPEEAAKEFLKFLPPVSRTVELRVAVLVPRETARDAFDPQALAAAAALVEEDLSKEHQTSSIQFKVEVFDDKCSTTRAYKYLTDALGTSDFMWLSGLAGPACGQAWADVARQSPTHSLPLLAYTPQAPVTAHESAKTSLQILAAGDARESASALAAFLTKFGWRRVAALSEPATHALIEPVRLHAKLEVHVEVPDAEADDQRRQQAIEKWASRVAKENAKILYLCVEDTRLARLAICAARGIGLSPATGIVWLICAAHKADWLQARPGENCTTKDLEEAAEGHFIVTPEWVSTWQNNVQNLSDYRRTWERRWRPICRRFPPALSGNSSCDTTPGPYAALLYDTLRQWAASLYHLAQRNPSAVDDLHNLDYVRSLINDTMKIEYNGLTGAFKWTTIDGAHVRSSSVILSQWDSKNGAQKVGTWNNGTLQLDNTKIKWFTSDGHLPDDGGERCALQGLADVLHTECRTAFVALCAFIVAILIAALAATVVHCKRRAEKEYRKRLQALGMRPLPSKPPGLDRWEIPRERVVINRKLGTGAFGMVYGGHALLATDRGWSAVAVKTLKAGANTEEKLDFLSEAEAMKRFDHKNVVRLLGVVTKTEPVCTVMEFMLYGDLKNYLLARRHLATGGGEEESGEADEASPRRLTGMALDVARALSYLAQLRYVHRDVAARNCLVSARRTVKLADFGMTRLVFENDYYRFSRKGMLPVRWMAPESLALGVFSPASDVWSFGVLLYEIVTFGSLPFQGLSNSEVLGKVKAGHTLDLPPGLKPQLEDLIKSCWQQDPKTRPTAAEVAVFLADNPRLLTPCLDIPLDALPLDADPPWRLPRDQAEARWVSWAAPASAATDTTYLSADGAVPLDTDSFLP